MHHITWKELELAQQFDVNPKPSFAVASPGMRPHDPIYDSMGNLVHSHVGSHMTGTQTNAVRAGIIEAASVALLARVVRREELHFRDWHTIELRALAYQLEYVLPAFVGSGPQGY